MAADITEHRMVDPIRRILPLYLKHIAGSVPALCPF